MKRIRIAGGKAVLGVAWMCLTSCGGVKSDTVDATENNRSEFTGVGEQVELDIPVSQAGVDIFDVRFQDNVTFRGKPGIAVNFQCRAYGFKGLPLFFYAYVLYENDYDFVLDEKGEKVCGFDTSMCVYDAIHYDGGITLYIPYSSLPRRYHGELYIDLVVIDGFDNIVATKPNNRLFYSTI